MAIDINVPVATNQVSADLQAMANNMKLIICGDGTTGRVLRLSKLTIADGTTASTIKCTMDTVWNGTNIAEQDNIPINSATGYYTYVDATGCLIIDSTAFSGNIIAVLNVTVQKQSIYTSNCLDICGVATSNDMYIYFKLGGGGTVPGEPAALPEQTGAGEEIILYITYLTSA